MDLIQWPKAKYWTSQFNTWIGCKKCSPACEHCYAASMTKRFGGSFEPHLSKQKNPPKKGVVFCGNMTDLFGEFVPNEDMSANIADCMLEGRSATYLWLTKRPKRMAKAINLIYDRLHSPEYAFQNHYFGFTAENEEWNDTRWRDLVMGWDAVYGGIPKGVKLWASCEPLLGQIDLTTGGEIDLLSWIVVGAESGPNRRPCKIEWVESIVEQCVAANIPVFVKQICLPSGKFTNKIEEFPEHLQIRQVPWANSEKGEI